VHWSTFWPTEWRTSRCEKFALATFAVRANSMFLDYKDMGHVGMSAL
jgi:hypothetical protein